MTLTWTDPPESDLTRRAKSATGGTWPRSDGALAFRSSLRTSLLVVGLASVVGLSLALLFSLSAPWRGPLTVSGHPIDAIVHDLQTGFFHR